MRFEQHENFADMLINLKHSSKDKYVNFVMNRFIGIICTI